MHLKKLLCAGFLTGAVALGSMTGFAFDMLKEADTETKDPSVIYTMYLGMPEDEFKDNFSGVTGWDYWDSTMLKGWDRLLKRDYEKGISTFTYIYTRKESYPGMKGIMQTEKLMADFHKDSPLEQISLIFSLDGDVDLSDKQVMKVIEEGEKTYKVMFNNLVNQFGKAESNRRLPLLSPFNRVQYGDIFEYTWRKPSGERYILTFSYCIPKYMKKGQVTNDQRYSHIVSIALYHCE